MRKFYLQANDQQDLVEWISVLNKATKITVSFTHMHTHTHTHMQNEGSIGDPVSLLLLAALCSASGYSRWKITHQARVIEFSSGLTMWAEREQPGCIFPCRCSGLWWRTLSSLTWFIILYHVGVFFHRWLCHSSAQKQRHHVGDFHKFTFNLFFSWGCSILRLATLHLSKSYSCRRNKCICWRLFSAVD